MFLEDFINRHRNANINLIKFPSAVFPVLMVLGLVIFLVVSVLAYIFYKNDIRTDVFNPKFMLMCGFAGGGLFLGSLYLGAFWGLLEEKKTGFKRSNYESLITLYIFVLFLSWPAPILIFGKIFYHYPVVRYPAYELEVKPTPEVKREIERLGLAEIKWHTPYDYSLDRQVIRYEFLESDDPYYMSLLKDSLISNVAGNKDPGFVNAYIPTQKAKDFIKSIDPDSWHYPEIVSHRGEEVCAVKITFLTKVIELEDLHFKPFITLSPLFAEGENSIYYDMSSVFKPYDPRIVPAYCNVKPRIFSNEAVMLEYFWMKQLMLPNLNEFSFSYRRGDDHYIIDFSFSNFLDALNQLS